MVYGYQHRHRSQSGWSGFGRTTFLEMKFIIKLHARFAHACYSRTTSQVLPTPLINVLKNTISGIFINNLCGGLNCCTPEEDKPITCMCVVMFI